MLCHAIAVVMLIGFFCVSMVPLICFAFKASNIDVKTSKKQTAIGHRDAILSSFQLFYKSHEILSCRNILEDYLTIVHFDCFGVHNIKNLLSKLNLFASKNLKIHVALPYHIRCVLAFTCWKSALWRSLWMKQIFDWLMRPFDQTGTCFTRTNYVTCSGSAVFYIGLIYIILLICIQGTQ